MQLNLEDYQLREKFGFSDNKYISSYLEMLYSVGNSGEALCQLCQNKLKILDLHFLKILDTIISESYYECHILVCESCKHSVDINKKDLFYFLIFSEVKKDVY